MKSVNSALGIWSKQSCPSKLVWLSVNYSWLWVKTITKFVYWNVKDLYLWSESGTEYEEKRTIDNHSGRGALASCHNVLGNAGVVACVGQTGLFDDEIMVRGDEEIGVSLGVDQLLVSLPLHLEIYTEENISQLQSGLNEWKTLYMA